MMVKRKKLWEYLFFYSCLEWCANYLWLWMQTCDLLRFNYSTIIILFLTSYFIVSKWWPISQWNKSYFFSTSKFRQWLDSEGDVVTFRSWHDAFYCLTHEWRITSCDLNQTRFQNLVLHNISFICSFRILWPKRYVLGQRKGKFWSQLPFNKYITSSLKSRKLSMKIAWRAWSSPSCRLI